MTKKYSPLMIIHLILMSLLIVFVLVSTVATLAGVKTIDSQLFFDSFSAGVYILAILNIAALGCGIIYLLQGYSKKAASYYKAFMVLTAALSVLNIYSVYVFRGFCLGVILIAVKVILLLALAFWKDLGKRNTWILFAIIIGIDLYIFVSSNHQNYLLYRLAFVLSKLLMDGTIGLAIRGKYVDKDARGTK